MKPCSRLLLLSLPVVFALTLMGCGRRQEGAGSVSFSNQLADLTNTMVMARGPLGAPSMASSYDRSGGNEDWGRTNEMTAVNGFVIADLRGPGCVKRLWMTGVPMDHPLFFFFDGETVPRIKTTMAGFFGKQSPFLPPLCDVVSDGCYSYMPLPFKRSLKIVLPVSVIKYERPYYQVNFETYSHGVAVESFSSPLSQESERILAGVRSVWSNIAEGVNADLAACRSMNNIIVKPGESVELINRAGPDVLRCFWISAVPVPSVRTLDNLRLLRQLSLQFFWDDATRPSVDVPLGDFFCNALRKWDFRSMFIEVRGGKFICRIPMPFAKKGRMELRNDSPFDMKIELGYLFNGGPIAGYSTNYFHACWSTTSEPGAPHKVLNATGHGFLAGCYLTEIGMDGSWNMLEGDDMIYIDGESQASFHGTGLEDYFNGGWYYKGLFDLPFHGLVEKSAIRTCQYRFNAVDPVQFKSNILFNWEFGDANRSHGYMSSVAYWYQDVPAVVASLPAAERRFPAADPLEPTAVMSALFEFERSGRYDSAIAYIDEYLEKYPTCPFMDMLKVRKSAYGEKLNGFGSVKTGYAEIVSRSEAKDAVAQAEALLWLHQSTSNAVVVSSFNGDGKVYIDGVLILESNNGNPVDVAWKKIQLKPGPHFAAVEFVWQRGYAWVSVQIRTSKTVWTADESWKVSGVRLPAWPMECNVTGPDWVTAPVSKGCPPFMPFWQFVPNAFIDSLASGPLSPPAEMAKAGKISYFGKTFVLQD